MSISSVRKVRIKIAQLVLPDDQERRLHNFLSSHMRISDRHAASVCIMLSGRHGNVEMCHHKRGRISYELVQISSEIAEVHYFNNDAIAETIRVQRIFSTSMLIAGIQRGWLLLLEWVLRIHTVIERFFSQMLQFSASVYLMLQKFDNWGRQTNTHSPNSNSSFSSHWHRFSDF